MAGQVNFARANRVDKRGRFEVEDTLSPIFGSMWGSFLDTKRTGDAKKMKQTARKVSYRRSLNFMCAAISKQFLSVQVW